MTSSYTHVFPDKQIAKFKMPLRPEQEDISLYEPLVTFSRDLRLLILKPCSDTQEPIRCNLIKASLDSDLRYDALSYTWGKPINEATITVNAVTVPVRRNLWDALCYLRGPEARTLWIDAVCINQNNVPERNVQVQMMRQIYEKAQRVVIWLGIERDESNLAFKFMAFISADRRKHAMKAEKFKEEIKYSGFGQELEAVQKLFQRPYWERLWIIQEVVVAQNAELHCGKEHISWEEFSRFLICLEGREIQLRSHTKSVLEKSLAFSLDRYRVYHQTDYSNLIELLEAFSSSLCFEVRDKIYGLVGLARDAAYFRIDYLRSIYGIFVDVIELQEKEDCSLLVACSQFIQRVLQGEVEKSAPQIHPQSKSLVGALGYETGSIIEVGPDYFEFDTASIFLSKSITERNFFRQASMDWRHDLELLMESKTKDLIIKRMRAVSGRASYAVRGGKVYYDYKLLLVPIESRYGLDDRAKLKPWGQLEQLETTPDLELEEVEEEGLRFVVGTGGYVGVATCGIRTADTICQFQGSDVVAILRWQETRSCYALVGSAIFPKRRNEVDTPLLKDRTECFQFSVPTSQECMRTKTISLWLSPFDLQKLTG
jgi:hypothetical protein